jgi:hypothetical protein
VFGFGLPSDIVHPRQHPDGFRHRGEVLVENGGGLARGQIVISVAGSACGEQGGERDDRGYAPEIHGRLVAGWRFLRLVDYQQFYLFVAGFEFQAELILDCREDGDSRRVMLQGFFGGPIQLEMVFTF